MRVLCVAEKPSIAKSISQILSGGRVTTRQTQSKFIRNFDFDYPQTNSAFTVTAVAGHLLEFNFLDAYNRWSSCDPFALFDAPLHAAVRADNKAIERNLLAEARTADTLMIWTDCDREGENIGWEIVTVCRKVRPNIVVKRARFSAIIAQQIHRAAQHPVDLDKAQADAVEARIILDLRIGAAFTRMQTLTLQQRLPQFRDVRVVSYGPCQFPTLGFVVARYNQVKSFTPEDFWYILLSLDREIGGENKKVGFTWRRGHLFALDVVTEIYEDIAESRRARVTKVTKKNVKKWKPLPLTTVELQKAGSRLLKLAPKKVLDISEKLYQQGFLSYPRTETDQYDPKFDFMSLIAKQTVDHAWGTFAQGLQDGGLNTPRRGKNNDKAHPPIHPTAHAGNLAGDDKRVYDFITRRFLASCSKDAEGSETTVEVEYGGEEFYATGLIVLQRNYLDVYPYDKWNGKEIPDFRDGEEFEPTSCEINEGQTTPPSLLTEADLVALMDKNGIGTDATIAQHIQTIIDREYVIERMDGTTKHLLPSTLGIGLVEGYNEIGFDRSLSKPQLRRETERSMVQVCEGIKSKDQILMETIEQYREIYLIAKREFGKVLSSVRRYIEGNRAEGLGRRDGGRNPDGGGGGAGNGGDQGSGRDEHDSDNGNSDPGHGGRVQTRSAGRQTRSSRGRTRVSPGPPCPPKLAPQASARLMPPLRTDAPATRSVDTQAQVGAPVTQSNKSTKIPQCRCGFPATRRKATQSSVRHGKEYYACSADKCDFIAWIEEAANIADDVPAPLVPVKRALGASRRGPDSISTPICLCKESASLRTVTKDGVNKGRTFWACSKGRDEGCRFFEWHDEPGKLTGESTSPTRSTSHNNASSSGRCFRCDQEGHWAAACPTVKLPSTNTHVSADSHTCFGCGKPGHFMSSCPGVPLRAHSGTTSSTKTGARDECFSCGRLGHWTADCPENGGPGPSKRAKSSSSSTTNKRAKTTRANRSGSKSTSAKRTKRDLKTKNGMFGVPDDF
ncbi:DNA topoisomerase III [Pisolithus thermaeus]|nr:DNA topoisomerase III [Pisolithus thermaeus]